MRDGMDGVAGRAAMVDGGNVLEFCWLAAPEFCWERVQTHYVGKAATRANGSLCYWRWTWRIGICGNLCASWKKPGS